MPRRTTGLAGAPASFYAISIRLLLCLLLSAPTLAAPSAPFHWVGSAHIADGGWGRMTPLGGGRWLFVSAQYPKPHSILQFQISLDNARTWATLGTLAEPGRDLDNGEIIRLPNGTILLSCRSVINNQSYHLPVYRSMDGGKSWTYLSMIAANDHVMNGNRPSQGLWEPHFFLLPDGRVAAAYSTEMHSVETPSYSQICAEKISSDGGKTWGPEITLAAQPGGGALRPGMPVITRMTNGRYIAVYEVVGDNNAQVHEKFSPNGVTWPAGLGQSVPDQHAGPWVASLSGGRLVVTSCDNQLSYSDNFGTTWHLTDPAWDLGGVLDWPAIYQTTPNRIACMVTFQGVQLRWGKIASR